MSGRRSFLFGLRADGSPTCHPMAAFEQDGALTFNTYRKSAKAQNFLRDPRAAVVLLPDWTTPPSQSKRLCGALEPTEAVERSDAQAAAELRDVPGSVKQRVRNRVAEGKRILFRLREGR